jgi:hypothetical protein
MNTKKSMSTSLNTFLKEGIEKVSCSICTETFSRHHVVIQIKKCRHQFGKECLETWLKQNKAQGTCPICRNMLFEAQRKSPSPPPPLAGIPSAPSVSREMFYGYYHVTENVISSARNGFLKDLGSGISHMQSIADGCLLSTTFTAYEHVSGPERSALRPYFTRIRSIGFFDTRRECPVTSLVSILSHIIPFCQPSYQLPDAVWRALLLFHTAATFTMPVMNGQDILDWLDFRHAACTLYALKTARQPTFNLWRILYLFLVSRQREGGSTR